MATSSEEILLRVGLDASAMKSGTYAMLDLQKKAAQDYVTFWERAVEKRIAKEAALESAANAASLARLEAFKAQKAALDAAWMAEQAAQHEIARGSGAFGSIAAGAAGSAAGSAGGAMMDSVARREILVMSRELASGNFKRFFSSFSIFVQHIGPAATGMAKLAGVAAAFVGTGFELAKLAKVYSEAGQSKSRELYSKVDLGMQTSSLAGSLDGKIDELQKKGQISGTQGDKLREMTMSRDAKMLGEAQRFILKQQLEIREKMSAEEKKMADAADYAKRAAEGKAVAEEKAAKHERESLEINGKLSRLWKERENIQNEAGNVEKQPPSVSDLAGRDFMSNLNAAYGAGGQYDLGLGNGPYAKIAQEYELAKKQQIWDRTYGNADQAEEDRKRAIALANQLGQAGLDTPAMKFDAMKAHLGDINKNIMELLKKASNDGIVINTKD